MRKFNRISLRKQIRSVKNAFFQIGDPPFKNLLPDSLIQAIYQSGNARSTVFTPLLTLKAFIFQVLSPTHSCKEAVAHILMERINFEHYPANVMWLIPAGESPAPVGWPAIGSLLAIT